MKCESVGINSNISAAIAFNKKETASRFGIYNMGWWYCGCGANWKHDEIKKKSHRKNNLLQTIEGYTGNSCMDLVHLAYDREIWKTVVVNACRGNQA